MTEGLTQAQVDYFISIATGMGIPAPEVPGLWRQHMTWADANGMGSYGGRPWIKFCEAQVEFIKERKGLSDKEARAEADRVLRRANEQEAKDAEDAAYALTTVSLRDWIASLRNSPETLSPHEAILARGPMPQGYEDAAVWLMAALEDVRTPDGRVPRRPDPCEHPPGCGLPVHSWTGFGGRRYSSGRCADHTPEKDWVTKVTIKIEAAHLTPMQWSQLAIPDTISSRDQWRVDRQSHRWLPRLPAPRPSQDVPGA